MGRQESGTIELTKGGTFKYSERFPVGPERAGIPVPLKLRFRNSDPMATAQGL